MNKPRELKLKCRFEGNNFAGYNVVEGSTTMDDPDKIYHVREVMSDEDWFEEFKNADQKLNIAETKLERLTRALQKAKKHLTYWEPNTVYEIIAIERGEE